MPDDATADAARMGAADVRGFAADRGLDVPTDPSPLQTGSPLTR
jgi:glycerol-3-phosphate dehydrogenase